MAATNPPNTGDTPAPADLQDIVRSRLRALRIANGWSLDELAERTRLGASTLSRIETGHRTIGLDVLPVLCAALHTDLASLLDVAAHDDVVIKPVPTEEPGRITWPLTRPDSSGNVVAAKWRLEPDDRAPDLRVHPGHDWFFVLAGAIRLHLGDRTIIVGEGEAAEFSTMTPHSITAHDRTTEIITIFDRTGHDAHARSHDHG
jgi:transcriptional regulator with XRE-family HTH domain